ncbi:MAG: hypothetical protein ACK4VI_00565 [Alphaproteobacteria bacterium]
MATRLSIETWKNVQGADAYAMLGKSLAEQYIYFVGHLLSEQIRPHVQSVKVLSDDELETCIKNAAVMLKHGAEIVEKMGAEEFCVEWAPDETSNMADNFVHGCHEMIYILFILSQRKASLNNRDLAARAYAIATSDNLSLADMTTQNPERLQLIIEEYIKRTNFAPKKDEEEQEYCRNTAIKIVACEQVEDGNFEFQLEASVTRRHGTQIGGIPILYPEIPETYFREHEDLITIDIKPYNGEDLSLHYEAVDPRQEGDYSSANISCKVPEHTEYIFPRIVFLGGVLGNGDTLAINAQTYIEKAKLKTKPHTTPETPEGLN